MQKQSIVRLTLIAMPSFSGNPPQAQGGHIKMSSTIFQNFNMVRNRFENRFDRYGVQLSSHSMSMYANQDTLAALEKLAITLIKDLGEDSIISISFNQDWQVITNTIESRKQELYSAQLA